MSEENNTTPELGLINIGGGAFCRVKKVTVICDITDADGNMLERDGFTQSPDSIIELSGAELAGLELPVQAVADHIYGNTAEE